MHHVRTGVGQPEIDDPADRLPTSGEMVIVAEEIVLTGPTTASAPVRLYDPVSGLLFEGPAVARVDFVLIDGVWLIDAHTAQVSG